MTEIFNHLVLGGILSTPIIVVYAITVAVLIRKRSHFAWILAIIISGSSIATICAFASPWNEFVGEIAAGVTFFSFAFGLPLVLLAANFARLLVRSTK